MKFTQEQRARIEEILPTVIDDPEYAASEIVRLEAERDRLREALQGIDWQAGSGGDANTLRQVLASIHRRAAEALASGEEGR